MQDSDWTSEECTCTMLKIHSQGSKLIRESSPLTLGEYNIKTGSLVSNWHSISGSRPNSGSSTIDLNMGCCFSTANPQNATPLTVPGPLHPPSLEVCDRSVFVSDTSIPQLILPLSVFDHATTCSTRKKRRARRSFEKDVPYASQDC